MLLTVAAFSAASNAAVAVIATDFECCVSSNTQRRRHSYDTPMCHFQCGHLFSFMVSRIEKFQYISETNSDEDDDDSDDEVNYHHAGWSICEASDFLIEF